MVRALYARTRSHLLTLATVVLAAGVTTSPTDAQQPAPPPAPSSQEPAARYRSPSISLVQPGVGSNASVPLDRPVVVFRFVQGEPTDPVDARTFAVAVDSQDRTSLFQVTSGEAWGPLADHTQPLVLGPHQVSARICSTRGA